MADLIYDTFYVIAPSGTPLFFENRVPLSQDEESVLIAGFLSAIEHFTKEAVKDEIKNIELVQNELIFRRYQNLLFVIRIKDQEAQPLLELFLQDLARTFILKYGGLDITSVETSQFDPFHKIITDLRNDHGFPLIEQYKAKIGITSIIGLYVLSRDDKILSAYKIREHSFFQSFLQDIFLRYIAELQGIMTKTLHRKIKGLYLQTEQNTAFLFLPLKKVKILFHVKKTLSIPPPNTDGKPVEAFTEVFTLLNQLISKGLNALNLGIVTRLTFILDDFTIIHDLKNKQPPMLYKGNINFLEYLPTE